jgi:hypothetical protein
MPLDKTPGPLVPFAQLPGLPHAHDAQKLQVQSLEHLSQMQFSARGAAASAAKNPLKACTSLTTSLLHIHNRGAYATSSL